jgi:hypothetical protein
LTLASAEFRHRSFALGADPVSGEDIPDGVPEEFSNPRQPRMTDVSQVLREFFILTDSVAAVDLGRAGEIWTRSPHSCINSDPVMIIDSAPPISKMMALQTSGADQ